MFSKKKKIQRCTCKLSYPRKLRSVPALYGFVFWEFDSCYSGKYIFTAAVSWICFPEWEFDSCTIISSAEQGNALIIAFILLYEIQSQYDTTQTLPSMSATCWNWNLAMETQKLIGLKWRPKKKKKSRNLLIISKTCFFHPGRMSSRWAAAFLKRRLLWCQFSKFLSGLIVPINFLISSFLLVISLSDCWQCNASFLLRTNSWSKCQTISQSHTPLPTASNHSPPFSSFS